MEVQLREVRDDDLPIFFEQQQSEQANHLAAFVRRAPHDLEAFNAHWAKIRDDESVLIRTIITGEVVGYIVSFEHEGRTEIGYWIGEAFWGRGIATRALLDFLEIQTIRPIYAGVAKDNLGSIRVLEKCGFQTIEEKPGFAQARGEIITELVMMLTVNQSPPTPE